MLKTCTSCGSQEFKIVMREEMTMPRKPSQSGYREKAVTAICVDCESEYTL